MGKPLDLDTEDRLGRDLDALEAVVGLLANQEMSCGAPAGGLSALLDLIHADMRAAIPATLGRPISHND